MLLLGDARKGAHRLAKRQMLPTCRSIGISRVRVGVVISSCIWSRAPPMVHRDTPSDTTVDCPVLKSFRRHLGDTWWFVTSNRFGYRMACRSVHPLFRKVARARFSDKALREWSREQNNIYSSLKVIGIHKNHNQPTSPNPVLRTNKASHRLRTRAINP